MLTGGKYMNKLPIMDFFCVKYLLFKNTFVRHVVHPGAYSVTCQNRLRYESDC